jgi:hypothetical protein
MQGKIRQGGGLGADGGGIDREKEMRGHTCQKRY